jgi:hypothetical protein
MESQTTYEPAEGGIYRTTRVFISAEELASEQAMIAQQEAMVKTIQEKFAERMAVLQEEPIPEEPPVTE